MFKQRELEYEQILVRRFSLLKDKKIIIYGTGKFASLLVDALKEYQIVGIMDRLRLEGSFGGYPIIAQDDLPSIQADALIIASLARHYKEIYRRIEYFCGAHQIVVYGENGKNLSCYYSNEWNFHEASEYYAKSSEELKCRIAEYDAVSFDVFDTLIMRRVLEPADVFDLMEYRLRGKGIVIPQFKKKRRTAEYESAGGDLNEIYRCFQQRMKYSDETIQTIMEMEIAIERECLLPRKEMVELMKDAIAMGKRVNLISDMYLPKQIMEGFLQELDITGYEELYISCEYGVGKGNGLYGIYKRKLGKVRALHIGDNEAADILSAQRYGLDTYEIKSAYAMLRISSFRQCLFLAEGCGTRTWLGMLAADLFNSPFALSHTVGMPVVEEVQRLARVFVAPVAFYYVQSLADYIQKKDYDIVLMTARDCYLFKKIYDEYAKYVNLPLSVYLLTSRRLCLSAALYTEEDIYDVERAFITDQTQTEFWMQFMHLDPKTMEKDAFVTQVLEKSARMRDSYLTYLEGQGIRDNGKYLLCDLISSGTVREALSRLVGQSLDAFFLCENTFLWETTDDVVITAIRGGYARNSFEDKHFFLEEVFTSLQPSVKEIGGDGSVIYTREDRSGRELQQLRKVHEAVLEFIKQFQAFCGAEMKIDESLSELLLDLTEKVSFRGEVLQFLNNKIDDDFRGNKIDIWKEMMARNGR